MTYSTSALSPRFGADSRYPGASTLLLSSLTPPLRNDYTFAYDSASAGELQQVKFPYGGCLGWGYVSFTHAGNRIMREVGSRFLAADSACAGGL